MSQKVLKFDSADVIRFIMIYRNHECLWDTENEYYKNREARNAALASFVQEFGVHGLGPKDITNKIKNLRTQYHGEKKKIKDSISSGSAEVYTSKLPWYNLMDSFVRKTSEHRDSISNTNDTSTPQIVEFKYEIENTDNFTNPTMHFLDEKPMPVPSKKPKITPGYTESTSKKLENIEKRAKLGKRNDELNNFGKYVASSLQTLNFKNSIHAQDEIQAILSKYKLRELEESENSTPTPESPSSKQSSEDNAWCDL